MAVGGDVVAVLAAKFAVMRRVADERAWRVCLGSVARAVGRGGVAVVARAAGVSETMVAAGCGRSAVAGVPEIGSGGLDGLPAGRARRLGGGRRRAEGKDGGLRPGLRGLAEAATRGDPVAGITWCSLSLREIARQLAGLGFGCGKDAAARMMRGEGYSLRRCRGGSTRRHGPPGRARYRSVPSVLPAAVA